MDMRDLTFRFPKPTPRVIERRTREKQEQQHERACRYIVRVRDKGRCRIPNCNNRDVEMHHIVPRSRSSRLKWQPSNNCLLCKGPPSAAPCGNDPRSAAMLTRN